MPKMTDGTSFDQAIVINEKSEPEGIAVEYEWLRNNYPEFKVTSNLLNIMGINHMISLQLLHHREKR
jgi:hypothetical protein